MQSLTILCLGRPDLILPIPFGNNSKRILFTLKEGSQYRLKFSFTVSKNIVLGLKYTNVVWKTSMKVDNSKRMLGTFSPQQEPYTSEMEEETTPSGMFAKGTNSARTKVLKKDMDVYQLQWYGYYLFRALACLHKQDLQSKYTIASKSKASHNVSIN
ncbi:rho GDP-dissociation inhibitor 1-like isoform X2 [Quercus suber]|uniref:rho GDP-dissociation inhibitor 1-like isoform X2 n=1 Tax=Quercus suber TaxID=58331 RepID=UPI0032DFF0F9